MRGIAANEEPHVKVGLISDTHDRLPTLHAALDVFRNRGIEVLLHPGDIIAPFAAKPLAAWTRR